jgi:hypothetical protein
MKYRARARIYIEIDIALINRALRVRARIS